MKNSRVKSLALAGILGAVAFLLMMVKINIPFLSVFADLEAAALAEIIGGFVLGPIGAIQIILIKLLLKIAISGTSTMFVGELQNFLLSCAYVLPAVLYYRKHKTKQGALVGLVIGTIVTILVSILTNLYMIFPFYIQLYGLDWDTIIGMYGQANPFIHDIPTFIIFSVLPFNIVSKVTISIVTMLAYKKLSVPLKRFLQ
jgi:riboflavin transporter FmnP